MSVKVVYGAFGFGGHPAGEDQKILDILTEHGIKEIDTAYIYVSLACHLSEVENAQEYSRKGARRDWLLLEHLPNSLSIRKPRGSEPEVLVGSLYLQALRKVSHA